MISRRSALVGGALVLAGPFINRGRFRLFANTGREYSARTIEIVGASTVIDMLGLLTLDYRRLTAWQTAREEFPSQEFDRWKRSGSGTKAERSGLPTSLPKTGSPLPFIGLTGLFSLGAAGALRLRR